jgi:5-aminolevulinate synthase
MNVSDYNKQFSEKINQLKKDGNYRYFLDVNKSAQHFPKFYYEDELGNKKMAVNWCSNDYLCMSLNEEVISKLSFVAHKSGAGSSGTRNISGTTIYHRELETTLANLHKKESALLFGGAYLANLTALSTIGKILTKCVFISDERNHASIIEGIRASGCERHVFKHNDLQHLEQILQSLSQDVSKIVVFESVYSMSGTIAPVKEIVELAKKYNALTYIDEVHAVGLYGEDGAGISSALGVREQIDIINGTLAKGFGVIGGYIAASKNIIDVVRSFGSGFIFTTSLPPSVCSAANKSVQLVRDATSMRSTYHNKVKLFRKILSEHGVDYLSNESQITNLPIGDSMLCKQISDSLLHEHGVYIQPINYPTVKRGEECFRITLSMRHTENDMIHLARSLNEVLHAAAV